MAGTGQAQRPEPGRRSLAVASTPVTPVAAAIRAPSRRLALPGRPRLSDVPTWGGLLAATAGALVLIGWLTGSDVLKSIGPNLLSMKANTAICFSLMGVGVVLLSRAGRRGPARVAGLLLVGSGVGIAIATGIQYVAGVEFGIDQLLFPDQAGRIAAGAAGRMAPLTVISFCALGLAAFIEKRAPQVVLTLCLVALLVSLLNVLTFVFDAAVPPILAGYTQMAPSTAIAMGVFAIAVIGLLGGQVRSCFSAARPRWPPFSVAPLP